MWAAYPVLYLAAMSTLSLDPAYAQRLTVPLRRAFERVPFAAVVWSLSFAWFLVVGLRTPLDEDEGFYALASELVAHGRLPYRDFFYPQSPLGPFVFAPFAALGARFVFLRLVAAAMAAIPAMLVGYAVNREARSRAAAVVAVLFFVTHELSWRWLPTIRPYAFGEACALGAFLLATPVARLPTRRELLLAGALASLAPLARLPLAPTVGITALAVLLRGRDNLLQRGACIFAVVLFGANVAKHPEIVVFLASAAAGVIAVSGKGGAASLARGAWFGVGVAIAATLILAPFALVAKDNLLFGLFDYHAETSKLVAWPHSRALLFATVGGGSVAELSGMGTQTVLLLLANLAALTLARAELRIASLTGAAVIAACSARHAPAMEHYLTALVPYLAIGVGIAFGGFERLARGRLVRPRFAVFGGGLALSMLATAASFERTWLGGMCGPWNFSALRPAATDLGLVAIRDAVRANPGPLLSYWPGSALGSATRMMPGFENQFARLVAGRRSPASRAELHLADEDELRAAVAVRTPSVVVVDRGTGAGREGLEELLTSSRYGKQRVVGAITIYVREP